jgi:hypothetical protein
MDTPSMPLVQNDKKGMKQKLQQIKRYYEKEAASQYFQNAAITRGPAAAIHHMIYRRISCIAASI